MLFSAAVTSINVSIKLFGKACLSLMLTPRILWAVEMLLCTAAAFFHFTHAHTTNEARMHVAATQLRSQRQQQKF